MNILMAGLDWQRAPIQVRECLSFTRGQVLELEPGTVKSRIARARLALRKALESEGNLLDGIASVRGKGP